MIYDKGKVIAGIIVFILIVAFPVYYNIAKPREQARPSLDTPVINQMGVKQCVMPKDYMTTEHMQLLDDWRDSVVRDGDRYFEKVIDGKVYEKSLQNTCMHCHSNKEKFCDECHNYASVRPYCWDCHISPKEKKS